MKTKIHILLLVPALLFFVGFPLYFAKAEDRGCCVVNMSKAQYYGENNCINNTTVDICQEMAQQTGSSSSMFLSALAGFDATCANNTTYKKYCTPASEQGCCVKDKTSQNPSPNNCVKGLLEENCQDTNNFFIKSNPQCDGDEAKGYCVTPSDDDDDSDGASGGDSGGDSGGIVPCGNTGGSPCTLCHLIIGINNIVKYGLEVLLVFAMTGIFISGVIYIISSGSEKMITVAKSALSASLIGFAIALGGWLMINIVMNLLAKPGLGIGKTDWHTFTCDTTSSALNGATSSESQKQCCIKSTDENDPNYGNKEANCPDATAGKTKAECEEECDQKPSAEIETCKEACTDETATCPEGGGTLGSCSDPACGGSTSASCGKVVDAAKQMLGWTYDQGRRMQNGYSDCSSLTNRAYTNSGCRSPGGDTSAQYSISKPIGSKSDLKGGDILVYRSGGSGHAALCESDGCATIVSASQSRGKVVEQNSDYMFTSGAQVIHASDLCDPSKC